MSVEHARDRDQRRERRHPRHRSRRALVHDEHDRTPAGLRPGPIDLVYLRPHLARVAFPVVATVGDSACANGATTSYHAFVRFRAHLDLFELASWKNGGRSFNLRV